MSIFDCIRKGYFQKTKKKLLFHQTAKLTDLRDLYLMKCYNTFSVKTQRQRKKQKKPQFPLIHSVRKVRTVLLSEISKQ